MIEIRTCNQCKAEKPLTDFYRHARGRGGYQTVCKECHKQNVRENRAYKAIYYRERDRERNRLPHRREYRRNYQRSDAGKQSRRIMLRWQRFTESQGAQP